MLSRLSLLRDVPKARGVFSVFAVVLLGGCAGTAEPGATGGVSPPTVAITPPASSPGTSIPVASPSPSPVYRPASAQGPAENVPLPKLPKLAKQKSKEGLIAFAEYWYALLNYGYETGDVEPVKAISGPDCVACNGFYKAMASAYSNNDWVTGGSVEIVSSTSEFVLTPDGHYQALVEFTQEPTVFYGPTDGIQGKSEGNAKPGVQIMEARHVKGAWFVKNVETIAR